MRDSLGSGPVLGKFPTWKTVQLGLRGNNDEYLNASKEKGFIVGRIGKRVVGKLPVNEDKSEARLVKIIAEDFQLPADASLWDIRDKHKEFGLKLCRYDVAPALREQYPDQPVDEILWVVSDTITDKNEEGVLCVGHEANRGRWLAFGCGTGCAWGKWRLKNFSPATQVAFVPMCVCECPWSRGKIIAIFEQP